jgi:hypothetical protein
VKYLTLCALLALAGCATCREHPVACAVGSALIVGSIAATIELRKDSHDPAAPHGCENSACLHGPVH